MINNYEKTKQRIWSRILWVVLKKCKQKLIRLVAVKNDKNFSNNEKENYKIDAIISKEKWKVTRKIQIMGQVLNHKK